MESNVWSSLTHINSCAQHVLAQSPHRPAIGLILGSGLGLFAHRLTDATWIDYSTIPGFPQVTVSGHDGKLVIGLCEGVPVVVMSGRFHYYEGHSIDAVVFPVRVFRQMGVRHLFVTNSAGGVKLGFDVGTLMIIEDHLNCTGINPLCGPNIGELGPRFPDMSEPYDAEIIREMEGAAQDLSIDVEHGVYLGVTGPTYETPAEIRMFRGMGADAVGMSTVPEVIIARHAGMRVAGMSCIANPAAGISDKELRHEDVKEAVEASGERFVALLQRTLARMRDDARFDLQPLAPAGASESGE